MKEDYNYKKSWQEHYAKVPYTKEEMSERRDISAKEFANLMMENFQTSGTLDLIKKEKVSMLASSVNTGERDREVLQQLDGYLGELNKFHRPSVTLTDFALTEEDGKSIIQKPEKKYKNLDARIVACDSYHLPFRENEFQILYERLGALWHAADEDMQKHGEGALVRNLLEEYKRVVKPGGKIIFDWVSGHRVMPPATAQMIRRAVKEEVKKFLTNLEFEFEITGTTEDEMSIILTNPDKKVDDNDH